MESVISAFDRDLLARLANRGNATPRRLAREFGRNTTYVRRRLVLLVATGHVRCLNPAREPRRYEPTAAGREAAASRSGVDPTPGTAGGATADDRPSDASVDDAATGDHAGD